MKNLERLLLAACVISLSGCVNRATATFDPGRDIVETQTVYVERFGPDQRELNKIIADNISVRGYSVTTGEEGDAPDNVDILVTYVDKWQWDMSMYLIELTISFRDPPTGSAFATGNSYHTSLTRLRPEKMVDEVLTNMFLADDTS